MNGTFNNAVAQAQSGREGSTLFVYNSSPPPPERERALAARAVSDLELQTRLMLALKPTASMLEVAMHACAHGLLPAFPSWRTLPGLICLPPLPGGTMVACRSSIPHVCATVATPHRATSAVYSDVAARRQNHLHALRCAPSSPLALGLR